MRCRLLPLIALPVALLVLVACEGDPGSDVPFSDATGADATGTDAAGADAARPDAVAGDVAPPPADAAPGDDLSPGDDDVPPVDPPVDTPNNRIDEWTYVVVTTEDMRPAFERLAEWRRRTGLPSVVVTMTDVLADANGRDEAETLRNWIRTAVHEHDTRIVLLGGDTPLVPHRTIWVETELGLGELTYETSAYAATELYFSDLDGDWDADGDGDYGELEDDLDMAPDVAIGRVPAASREEADAYVDKVLAYERADAVDYQDRVLFLSEYTGYGTIDASMLLDPWARQIFGDGFDIEKLYDQPDAFPDAVQNTRAGELRALVEGKGMVVHLGHGSEGSFAFLDIDDVRALDHAPRFNVFVSCACYSGDFASGGTTTGEQFVLNPDGGGVAYIGNTDIGIGFPSGATYLKRILQLVIGSDEADAPRLGEAFAEARTSFVPNGGGVHTALHADRYTMFVVDLLGDPGLRVWRGSPQEVTLGHPARHTSGEPLVLAVSGPGTAPVPDATVTLYRAGELLVTARTDADGTVGLDGFAAAPGPIDVTVSGAGVLPQTATIVVE